MSDADYEGTDYAPQSRSFINPRGLSTEQQRQEAIIAQDRMHIFSTLYPIARAAELTQLPTISVRRGGIRFPTNDERTTMRKTEDILTEAENLRAQAERLEEIAAQRARYGEDSFKNGTVLKIDMKYRTGVRSYAYAVIKIGGKFYLSGRMSRVGDPNVVATADSSRGYTWEQFVAWLAQGDATVWQAGNLKQVL